VWRQNDQAGLEIVDQEGGKLICLNQAGCCDITIGPRCNRADAPFSEESDSSWLGHSLRRFTECAPHQGEKDLIIKRLGQKSKRAGFHRGYANG
jgi:hypothetical protein